MVVPTERLREAPRVSEAEEIRRLEELWDVPTAGRAPVRRRVPFGPLLAAAWVGVLTFILAFEPSASEVAAPGWAEAVALAFWLALPLAAIAAAKEARRAAYSLSLGAAGLGLPLAYACQATGHHAGSFWLVELGLFAGLAAASAAGLVRRRRG